MIKKTIKFEDFDGNPQVEDFYFHLNKAELTELEVSEKGGLGEYLRDIVAAEDGQAIIEAFKKIITMSVGKRSDDGKQFIKNDEIRNSLVYSNAYSELFMELATDADKGAEFVRGCVPSDLAQEIERQAAQSEATEKEAQAEAISGELVTNKDPREMTREELLEAYRAKNQEQVQQSRSTES